MNPCHYIFMNMFADYDSAQQGKYDHLRWLEEIDIPKNLKMDGVEYLGPQILDDWQQYGSF